MGSGRLATLLDADALELQLRVTGSGMGLFPAHATLSDMQKICGPKGLANVAQLLGGRSLIRYLWPGRPFKPVDVDALTFVTPTPLSPEEASVILALPAPATRRQYVVLLDSAEIESDGRPIFGPRYTRGGGIEFLLTRGYPAKAILPMSPDDASAQWEMEVT